MVLSSCGADDPESGGLPDLVLTRQEPVAVIPGCEGLPLEVCDVLQTECQTQIFEWIACLRGDEITALELPTIERLDVQAAAERVEAREPDSRLLAHIRGLELLGLAAPGQIVTDVESAPSRVEGVLAFYSPSKQKVVLIDRGEPVDDLESNAVLAHELVHALQDAEHDLLAFGESHRDNRDQDLAALSLVEGEATLYELLMIAAHRGIAPEQIDYAHLFELMSEVADEATIESQAPFLSSRGIFPYTHGARYAGAIWRDGGSAALDAQYTQPPDTTFELLYGQPEATAPIESLLTIPAALDGYEFLADDVVGAWVLQSLVFAQADANNENATAWAGVHWRGDRFWLYHRQSDGAVAALWKLNWQDAASAERFESVVKDLLGATPSFDVVTEGKSTRIVSLNAAALADEQRWSERFASVDFF